MLKFQKNAQLNPNNLMLVPECCKCVNGPVFALLGVNWAVLEACICSPGLYPVLAPTGGDKIVLSCSGNRRGWLESILEFFSGGGSLELGGISGPYGEQYCGSTLSQFSSLAR